MLEAENKILKAVRGKRNFNSKGTTTKKKQPTSQQKEQKTKDDIFKMLIENKY